MLGCDVSTALAGCMVECLDRWRRSLSLQTVPPGVSCSGRMRALRSSLGGDFIVLAVGSCGVETISVLGRFLSYRLKVQIYALTLT